MDDQEYLEPSFDPSTLTVPRLRSILVAHNVNYPSSAKKSQLIDLFNEHVVPQARKIRSANARVKRTSKGIVDVPASQSAVNDDNDDDDEEEEELMAPPSTRSGGRRTTRARTEEAQEVVPTPKSTRYSTAPPESVPRRASSKHARSEAGQYEAEQLKRPASRKSRLSAQTPVAKVAQEDDDSPFSSENVFQTGSSPPVVVVESDRRRTTTSAVKDPDRRRSREAAARRKTEEVKPLRQQTLVKAPVSAMKKRKEDVEFSEEFTPDEQMELLRAQQSGEVVPTTRTRTKRPASKTARTGISAVLVALLGGLATLYSQEKFQIGYCGEQEGHPSREIAGVEIPDWADVVRPHCEPCPLHAICGPNLETICEPDFVLTQHPLSLNGILPIPPTCEPDSVKAKKVEKVKERAIYELREHNAKVECGESVTPEIRESELKARVSSKRLSRMGDREFEELWASAIGEVRDAEEVVQGSDGSSRPTLRSTSLARLPLSCAIRRSLRETLRQYFWQLIASLSVLTILTYTRYTLTSSRESEVRAQKLAGLALDKLSTQAALHAADPEVYREGYISMAQLRDDVLRSEWSTWNRRKVWDEVQRKVEKNANVRPMVREGRSGDVGRVWEWVGMIESPQQGNGGLSGGERRRKSGRVSFGGERWIEPSSVVDGSEMSEIRKWEEGRAQYY